MILVFVITGTQAQISKKESYIELSAGLDLANTTIGSPPTRNKPALDFTLRGILVGSNIEVDIAYERFSEIHFTKWSLAAGYAFPLYMWAFKREIRTTFIPTIEPYNQIIRNGGDWDKKQGYMSFFGSANLGFRWQITEHWVLGTNTNFCTRNDLYDRYPEIHKKKPVVISTYGEVHYRF